MTKIVTFSEWREFLTQRSENLGMTKRCRSERSLILKFRFIFVEVGGHIRSRNNIPSSQQDGHEALRFRITPFENACSEDTPYSLGGRDGQNVG
jgi:hypothetical protein